MAGLNVSIDLSRLTDSFRGLQGRHPGLWPLLPRATVLAGIFAAVMVLAWAGYWRGQIEDLEAGQAREEQLKLQYAEKLKKAINLAVLRKQKEQVSIYVNQLEKQLPSKAEMDALLTDINQAGASRGLQFELFKPGQVVVREFYAELPISIKLGGGYHELAGFVSDVSNLARIVTINNLNLQLQERTGQLTLEAVAKTFRYLDSEEIAQGRREAAKARQPAGAKAPVAAQGQAK